MCFKDQKRYLHPAIERPETVHSKSPHAEADLTEAVMTSPGSKDKDVALICSTEEQFKSFGR